MNNNIWAKCSCGITVDQNKCISYHIRRREGLPCTNYGLQIIYIYVYIRSHMRIWIFLVVSFNDNFSSHTIEDSVLVNFQIK